MHRGTFILLALGLLAGDVAYAQSKKDAFLVDRRSFKKTYPVIALAPVDADPYLQMPPHVAAIIEEEITARLQKEKFTVIPSSVLGNIRSIMEERVGGTTDAESGALILPRARAVREHAFRELWFREQFDALAIVRVAVTTVPMESDRVEWDGAKRRLETEGRRKKYSANVAVTSVTLALYDESNTPIYTWHGGLEPIMYRQEEQLQPLPVEKLFQNEDWIREAAESTVDPF